MGLAGLGVNLSINSYRTLKLLAFTITVVGNNYDPLCGLSRELRFIAGNNILEELQLDVRVYKSTSCRIDSEDWSALDSVLTESGAFPMLHRVSIKMWWYRMPVTGTELREQEAIVESLMENRFPQLRESKMIELNFYPHVSGG